MVALTYPLVSMNPDDRPEDTRQSFTCACGKVGTEEFPDADSYVDELDCALPDAQLCPYGGWACSRACLSQAMFEAANPAEKAALLDYERALLTITETLPLISGPLKTWAPGGSDSAARQERKLLAAVENSREAIAADKEPRWINENGDPADRMRAAIEKAVRKLDWIITARMKALIVTEFNKIGNARYPDPRADVFIAYWTAETLASVGLLALELQAAVNGEVA